MDGALVLSCTRKSNQHKYFLIILELIFNSHQDVLEKNKLDWNYKSKIGHLDSLIESISLYYCFRIYLIILYHRIFDTFFFRDLLTYYY